ncbi:MAG: nitronate monooxygenase [Quisquiliibacterium sp.]
MARKTLQELLGIELPIVQAPMAGVQGSELAVAVSNAGGLGSLACAVLSPDAMRSELQAIRAQTDKPFNVNFFCHQPPAADAARERAWREMLAPYFREHGMDAHGGPAGAPGMPFDESNADLLEPFAPAVVSFHFGLPSPALLARVKSWGSRVFCSATTVDEALWLQEHGADVIIAQGLEAGGHRGMFLSQELSAQMGTMALVPQVVRAVKVPVIAAGGIASAQAVAAALALGAAGVQVGTAYLLCPEARTSALHRAALKSPQARHTAITNVFSGRPARAIMNRLIEEQGPMRQEPPAFPMPVSLLAPLRARAEAAGSAEFSSLWSGQNASGCKEVPAAVLTRELAGVAG